MEFLRVLADLRTDFFDVVNLMFTKLGEESVIFLIICIIYWCINKKFGYQLGFTYLIAGFIINVVKIFAQIERPFVKDENFEAVEGALRKATGYSFPSGHTQAATSLYGTLSMYTYKKSKVLAILLYIPIILVGFSRMYLGVHTPYDVAAALIIGILVNILMYYIFTHYSLDSSHYIYVFIGTAFAGLLLGGLGVFQMVVNDIPRDKINDCIKIAACVLGFIIGWYIEVTKIKFNERGIDLKGQLLKLLCGVIGLLFCYKGIGKILGLFLAEDNYVLATLPYFMTTFWVTGIFPILIKKFFTSPYNYKN